MKARAFVVSFMGLAATALSGCAAEGAESPGEDMFHAGSGGINGTRFRFDDLNDTIEVTNVSDRLRSWSQLLVNATEDGVKLNLAGSAEWHEISAGKPMDSITGHDRIQVGEKFSLCHYRLSGEVRVEVSNWPEGFSGPRFGVTSWAFSSINKCL